MDAFEELARFAAPFDLASIRAALDGRPSRFDVDGTWEPHRMGRPRCAGTADAFDGAALLAGMQAVCWLGTQLPADDPYRLAVPTLYSKICARLANPDLLIYGGSCDDRIAAHGFDSGAVLRGGGYLYFRPATLAHADDLALCRLATTLCYPHDLFPWSSLFPAWEIVAQVGALVARAAATPLAAGNSELDPRLCAPAIVEDAVARHQIDADAATL